MVAVSQENILLNLDARLRRERSFSVDLLCEAINCLRRSDRSDMLDLLQEFPFQDEISSQVRASHARVLEGLLEPHLQEQTYNPTSRALWDVRDKLVTPDWLETAEYFVIPGVQYNGDHHVRLYKQVSFETEQEGVQQLVRDAKLIVPRPGPSDLYHAIAAKAYDCRAYTSGVPRRVLQFLGQTYDQTPVRTASDTLWNPDAVVHNAGLPKGGLFGGERRVEASLVGEKEYIIQLGNSIKPFCKAILGDEDLGYINNIYRTITATTPRGARDTQACRFARTPPKGTKWAVVFNGSGLNEVFGVSANLFGIHNKWPALLVGRA